MAVYTHLVEDYRADAKYAEALSCPYYESESVKVKLDILDSRYGLANAILATINGRRHVIELTTHTPEFLPEKFAIEQATNKGYASYQKKNGEPIALDVSLVKRLN